MIHIESDSYGNSCESVIWSDPYNPPRGDCMEFRLLYSGLLLGANKNDTRSSHKHDIRRHFHSQLAFLWNQNRNLREWCSPNPKTGFLTPTWKNLSEHFVFNGVGYVPLSFDDLGVACKLDILMFRPEMPGQTIIQGGDIDNRLKTLFDALRIPKVGEVGEEAEGGSNPFFCLLQDDSLINHVSVTTDWMLGEYNKNEVRLVITVSMWNIVHTMLNMGIF
jgi:hypothetical protein